MGTTPGNEPKRHHYVPECYLKMFAWHDGRLRIRRKNGGGIFTPAPENVMVERYLYNTAELQDGFPPNWIEKRFHTAVEGIFSKVARETLLKGVVPDLPQARAFVLFAIHQHFRVPSMWPMMKIDANTVDTDFARQYTKSFAAISTATIFKNFGRLNKALRMKLWTARGPQLFASSDNPVSHWHYRNEWVYHVDSNEAKNLHGGTIFLFPLSPRFLLEFTPGAKNGDTLTVAEMNNFEITLVNSHIATAASRFIILPEE